MQRQQVIRPYLERAPWVGNIADVMSKTQQGKYLYCILKGESAAAIRSLGIGEEALHSIHFRNLAAIVTNVPLADYYISPSNVMIHESVMADVMQICPILPVRFGTVARNSTLVEKLLMRHFAEFSSLIDYLEDKVELRVEVFWDREAMLADISTVVPIADTLWEVTAESPYLRARARRGQVAEIAKEAVKRWREVEREAILDELRPLAVDIKIRHSWADDKVLDAAFLVEKKNEAAFNMKLQGLEAKNAHRFLIDFGYAVPPTDFLSIAVHWDKESF